MTWIKISNTNLEYDTEALDKLPETRKKFFKLHPSKINKGIGINSDGMEIYIRVRKIGDPEPLYFENEYNKTYLDSLIK